MATREERDKYRSILEDAEQVQWRYGHPPDFNSVNQLFEEGQTKVLRLPSNVSLNVCATFIICESDSLIVFGFNRRYGQKGRWKRRFKMRSSHGRWSSHTRSTYKTSRL